MRIMSLDLGTKTIGVAVSDATAMIARGVETIRRKGIENDFIRLGEIIALEEVETIVVGYPKNMNGSIGERAQISEVFVEEIKTRYPTLKVVLLGNFIFFSLRLKSNESTTDVMPSPA